MSLKVRYIDGKKFEVECRSHRIIVDQEKSEDGADEGMNPIELFNASLASCVSYYALMFLKRHLKNLKGFEIQCSWEYSEDPHRIGEIYLIIYIPQKISENLREGLIRTVKHCTVKNSLDNPPKIQITLK
jgi:uncharacterized OsmC-like protein